MEYEMDYGQERRFIVVLERLASSLERIEDKLADISHGLNNIDNSLDRRVR